MADTQKGGTRNLHFGCGYIIERATKADEVLGPEECAFATYELVQSVALGLPQPTVAFFGPGQKIAPHFGAASTSRYSFVAGVVFKNCIGQSIVSKPVSFPPPPKPGA
jgi:hypothetical protein